MKREIMRVLWEGRESFIGIKLFYIVFKIWIGN
jgi:hypothetical protein